MTWIPFVFAALAYDPSATVQQVCAPGYSHSHRHVPYRLRDRVYTRDGLARGFRRGYVIDHRIPLEIGGSNDESNLFAQLRTEAKRKDRLEDELHAEVCSGRITLVAARTLILKTWSR